MSAAVKPEMQEQHHVEAAFDIPTDPARMQFPEEPDPDYKLGWRSGFAITALALANCCAALTNTVRLLRVYVYAHALTCTT